MMFLSVLLAITCFAQCTPVESLWNPNVAIVACPLNLTNVAFVMCCESLKRVMLTSALAAASVLTTDSSLVRGNGFFPCFLPLVHPLETQHEAKRQDYYLHLVEPGRIVGPPIKSVLPSLCLHDEIQCRCLWYYQNVWPGST